MSIAILPTPPTSHHLDRRALELINQANAGTDDELLNTEQLALWLGVSTGWLEIGRSQGYGPPFIRLGRRVRYRRADINRWLQERAHRRTAEYADPERPQGRQPGSKVIDGKVVPPDPAA